MQPLTKIQALAGMVFHVEDSKRSNGQCAEWRRNGSTKTWKTRPDEYSIPVKYGRYSYGYITQSTPAHMPEDCPNTGEKNNG